MSISANLIASEKPQVKIAGEVSRVFFAIFANIRRDRRIKSSSGSRNEGVGVGNCKRASLRAFIARFLPPIPFIRVLVVMMRKGALRRREICDCYSYQQGHITCTLDLTTSKHAHFPQVTH